MKYSITLSHIIFLILFIFSLLFYRERVAFIDCSYHLFKLIHHKSLMFEANRYGAIFTKWPALLFIKFNAPLQVVMLVFSSWFIIWYYLIFLFITYVLKSKKTGIALAISLVVGYGNTFYHSVTETHQALVYCLLFYAWISTSNNRNILLQIIIGTLLIILSFLTHPIAFLVILTVLGFHLSKKRNYLKPFNYSYLFIILIVVITKLVITDGNSYEGQFFNFSDLFTSLKFRMSNWDFYFQHILFLYFSATIFVFIIGYFTYKQKTFPFIYASIAPIILLFLLILFYKGGAYVMKERAILPFCTIITLFLIETVFEKKLTKTVLTITSIIGIIVIFNTHISHTKRIENYLASFNAKQFNSTKKIIVPQGDINTKNQITTWSIPYETLLLSSIKGAINSKSIYPINKPNELNDINLTDENLFLGAPFYLKNNASNFNKNYFNIDNCTYLNLSFLPK